MTEGRFEYNDIKVKISGNYKTSRQTHKKILINLLKVTLKVKIFSFKKNIFILSLISYKFVTIYKICI